MDELPDYMKALYRALLNVYDEVGRDLAKQGRAYGVHHSKDAVWFFSMSCVYIYIYSSL